MNRRMPLRQRRRILRRIRRHLSAWVDRLCKDAIERAQAQQREGEGSGIPDPGALT